MKKFYNGKIFYTYVSSTDDAENFILKMPRISAFGNQVRRFMFVNLRPRVVIVLNRRAA